MPKNPKKKRSAFRNWSEYLLIRLVIFTVGLLGLRAMYAIGWILSGLLFRLDRRHRKLAIMQIKRSFPELDDKQVLEIARRAFDSAVLLGMEMAVAHKHIDKDKLARKVKVIGLEDFGKYLSDAPRGAITVTGHYGNWEVGGFTLAALGFAGAALARPLDNPILNRYVKNLREVENMRIVDKKGGVKEASSALAQGWYAGFIGDQDAGKRGIFVNFFGRKASTVKSVALLAIRNKIPILVCSVRRQGRKFEFEFTVPRIITPDEWADREDAVFWITQEYTKAIEDIIRQEPEQYFGWLHNRWKNRPDGRRVKF